MSEPSQGDASPPPDEVRAELERILCSQALGGSDQLKRLLRLVVERTLNGRPELLKEYNLGLEVFQRPPDYDPKIDPIVRVQARRLRSKLDEYYAGEGADASFVIHIPKGAYVPFGGGSRTCIGMRFGELEVRTIASAILSRFELTLPGDFELKIRQMPTISPRDGLPMLVRARERTTGASIPIAV